MKVLSALFLCAAPLPAQIYADVSTTLGDFTIELYYEDSPKTVANFMTLAEGSRAWVDPATGIVKNNTPYYNGIIFHRVIAGFMNQVGSPQGDGSDGPGYTFPDEVSNGVLHDEPYLLSSANSGPNTNGSQMFITVDVTPWLDGLHTVFGKVTSGTDIIDTINQVPVNGSQPINDVSISSITIRQEGAEALAFNPLAQGLPEITHLPAQITRETDEESMITSLVLKVAQTPGTTLAIHASNDLLSWTESQYHEDTNASPLNRFELSTPLPAQEFYRTSLITWSADAAFPSELADYTLSIDSNIGIFDIHLGDDPATLTFSGVESPTNINLSTSIIETDGYGATLIIFSDDFVPFRFRLGADLPIGTIPSGRMSGTAFTQINTSLNGTFTLTPTP